MTEEGVNVAVEIVAAGWASVQTPLEGKQPRNQLHAELLFLSDQASHNKAGIFQVGAPPITNPKQLSSLEIFEKIKGKPLQVIVDYVRDGCTVRLQIPETRHKFLAKTTGCQTPYLPPPGKNESAEPFAVDAKNFAERNLLHRDITFTAKGVGRSDEIHGVITMAGIDLAKELLRLGYAKVVEWNAGDLLVSYLAIQEKAQQAHKSIWSLSGAMDSLSSSSSPSSSPSSSSSSFSRAVPSATRRDTFEGKAREITSNGSIVIIDPSTRERVSAAIASIKTPKFGSQEPYAWEAKELLRSLVLGKIVKARLEYVRQIDGSSEREFYSIAVGKNDLALALIEKGYAQLVPHRDAEPRASNYDQLIIAEKKAKGKPLGIWNKTTPAPVHRVNDLTNRDPSQKESVKKSIKSLAPLLSRKGKMRGVVEYVFNPGHLKVHIPKEQVIIPFSLESIRSPSSSDPDSAVAKACEDALEFVKERVLQQEVEVIINGTDSKSTNFVGTLLDSSSKNLAVLLVEEGLVNVFAPSASRSIYSQDFINAEKYAKDNRLGVWTNYDPEEEERKAREADAQRQERNKPQYINIMVTEVVDGQSFYAQYNDPSVKATIESLMQQINSAETKKQPLLQIPKVGSIVASKFSADKLWYRVKVMAVEDKKIDVLYIDYGNSEVVPLKNLSSLDVRFTELPAQAFECRLAYIRVPSLDADCGEDAALLLKDLCWGIPLLATIEYTEKDIKYVSLANPAAELIINCQLVKEGLATVEKISTGGNKLLVQKLRTEQEEARKNRLNLWKYGDFEDDEE